MSELSMDRVREWAATEPWEPRKPIHDSILSGYGALFNQQIALARMVLALTAQRDEAVAVALALNVAVRDLAIVGYKHWDADRDSKVGKVLAALTGQQGMRPDLDAIRARLAALTTPTGGTDGE